MNWQVDFRDVAPAQAEGDFVVRRGKFFEIGEYPDQEFALTEAEADAAIAQFIPAPLNIEHIPSIFDGKLGEIRRLWRKGRDILAEYKIPAWLHDVMQQEPIKVSSEWDRRAKTAVGGALVLHPRIQDAAILSAFSAVFGNAVQYEAIEENRSLHGRQRAETPPCRSHDPQARLERAGKGTSPMSLIASIKALFQRAGVPREEIDAQLREEDSREMLPEMDTNRAEMSAGQKAQMRAFQTEIATMKEALAAQSKAAQFASDVQTMEEWKRQGKMTPNEADEWRRIAQETPAAFAAAKPALESRTPLPILSRGIVDGEAARQNIGEANPDADRLDQMTRAHAKENHLPYHAAFSAVCKAYPELARSYRAGMEAN